MPKVRPIISTITEDKIERYANRCAEALAHENKPPKPSSRISVSFSDTEMQELKDLASRDGRSLSAFIRMHILHLLGDAK